MSPDLVVGIFLALLGLAMGSAVTAIAHRVPRDRSWARGRSACTTCGTELRARDLVPVLSFLVSRGRCRHCGARISLRYPVTEILCAAWAVLLFRTAGLSPAYPFLALWGFLLIALMWIDLDFKLLPDALTFPGSLVALAAALQWPHGAHRALLGVAAGSGTLWLLAEAWVRVRKIEGLGRGDIKLAAMFGIVLGWKLSLLTLMLAALAGTLWGGVLIARGSGHARTELPFGTVLAPAAMVAFLWGDAWMSTYLSLLAGG
ncbi:MAG TPA: prepilin peptidase [Candidatus Eisenbacteria bacterium]